MNSLNCTNIYFCCVLIEKTMAQLEFPLFKHALRLTKLELAKASEEKNMKCHQCFLYYFTITCISSWKRPWPFIWTKLYFRHPRILCAKFGWNWLSGSRVEDFFYLVYVFSLFWWNLPFKKGWGPSFEKKLIPFTQGCFVQIWIKLAQWFSRRSRKYEKFTTI